MTPLILVVDDERSMRELLTTQLEDRGWQARAAANAGEALQVMAERDVDLVLTDLRMPGMSGAELCKEIVNLRPDIPVVVMTGFGSVENAIAAIRAGAYDFVTKPFAQEALEVMLERALHHRRLTQEMRRLRRVCGNTPGFAGMIGTSPAMQRMYELIDRVSGAEASVLLVGESGSGKELVARALHSRSPRSQGPFVALNCAAVPEQLLESELFGHTKGAFTDARAGRVGLLRQAAKGTLFLDEIGDMSSTVQPKLLRALQERLVRPVGSDEEVEVDVRVISATNHDLRAAVAGSRFRADLFYRLAVVTVHVPPLRERGDDILLLAEHFCEQLSEPREPVAIGPAAASMLANHNWPGNVRELRNAIEHALALCGGQEIRPDHLPLDLRLEGAKVAEAKVEAAELENDDEPAGGFLPLGEIERRYILRVLSAVGGNKSRAAKILGIDRKTLHARLQRYDGG